MIEYDQAAIRQNTEKRGPTHFTRPRESKEKETCWIHSENHPIWVCKSFKAKPVSDRIALIQKHYACHAYLEIKCVGVANAENCRKKFRCSIEGCNEAHNKLLHQ